MSTKFNWTKKKVLVTGAGGFIGSHLTERLAELGARTRAFLHYRFDASRGWLSQSRFSPDIEFVAGDIADYDSIWNAMKDVDIVFHLAALIGIPYSYQAPISYVNTNIIGTLNILRAARHLKVEKVIHTSTSEAYGTAQYVPIDEKHPLQGQSPYSATKIGADKLAESFYLSFKLPVVTVRPFNTFGPRQSARAVIPTIITQCLSGKKVKLGSLHPTRDLNYVSNTVDGFIRAAEVPQAVGKVLNLGTGKEIDIGNLVNLISRLTGTSIHIQTEKIRVRPKASEVERLLADNRLAKKVLSWTPQVNLEDGLSKTIQWIKLNRAHYRTDHYVV